MSEIEAAAAPSGDWTRESNTSFWRAFLTGLAMSPFALWANFRGEEQAATLALLTLFLFPVIALPSAVLLLLAGRIIKTRLRFWSAFRGVLASGLLASGASALAVMALLNVTDASVLDETLQFAITMTIGIVAQVWVHGGVIQNRDSGEPIGYHTAGKLLVWMSVLGVLAAVSLLLLIWLAHQWQ